MKSLNLRNVAGQANLKGRKFAKLTCGCCVLQDLRDDEFSREARVEIAQAVTDKDFRKIEKEDDLDVYDDWYDLIWQDYKEAA